MSTQEWTPQLVENMLYREFVKGEQVDSMLPPKPTADPQHSFYSDSSDSMKFLSKYTKMGPSANNALQSNNQSNVNIGGYGKSATSTPQNKHHPGAFAPSQQTNQQPGSRTPKANQQQGALPPRTPKSNPGTPTAGSNNGGAMAEKRPASSNQQQQGEGLAQRRARFEWPKDVPTNVQLKSDRNSVKTYREQRIIAQDHVDFDLVFKQQQSEMPLEKIFARYPKVLRKVQAVRGMSGDWRNDVFTAEEERQYKNDIKIDPRFVGPSQAGRNKY